MFSQLDSYPGNNLASLNRDAFSAVWPTPADPGGQNRSHAKQNWLYTCSGTTNGSAIRLATALGWPLRCPRP